METPVDFGPHGHLLSPRERAFFGSLAELSAAHRVAFCDHQMVNFWLDDEKERYVTFAIREPGKVDLRVSVTIASRESCQTCPEAAGVSSRSPSGVGQTTHDGLQCRQASQVASSDASAPRASSDVGQDQTLGFPPLSLGSVLQSAPSKAEGIAPPHGCSDYLCVRCLDNLYQRTLPDPDRLQCPGCGDIASAKAMAERQERALAQFSAEAAATKAEPATPLAMLEQAIRRAWDDQRWTDMVALSEQYRLLWQAT